MNKKKLLEQFKQDNPKLVELGTTIRVAETLESWNSETNENIVFEPPLVEIEAFHPFIFDARLIPKDFNEIKVIDRLNGSYPHEFPSNKSAMPLEDYEAPERYIRFVDNNLELISKKIRIPNLTRGEALVVFYHLTFLPLHY